MRVKEDDGFIQGLHDLVFLLPLVRLHADDAIVVVDFRSHRHAPFQSQGVSRKSCHCRLRLERNRFPKKSLVDGWLDNDYYIFRVVFFSHFAFTSYLWRRSLRLKHWTMIARFTTRLSFPSFVMTFFRRPPPSGIGTQNSSSQLAKAVQNLNCPIP
jgi:hypothetical protein